MEGDGLSHGVRRARADQALDREVRDLTERDGRELAGSVAKLVDRFTFHRGLVAEVELSGARFVEVAAELFERAPIQHLKLNAPLGGLSELFAVKHLGRLTSLAIERQPTFGDAGAIALASCEHLTGLRWLSLHDCGIDRAGVYALAGSPYLRRLEFLGLWSNPFDPTPGWVDHAYGVPSELRRPAIADDLEKKFGRLAWLAIPADPSTWPPDRESLATTD